MMRLPRRRPPQGTSPLTRSRVRSPLPLLGLLGLLVPLVGCGDVADAPAPGDPPAAGPAPTVGAGGPSEADLPPGAQARSLLGEVLFPPPLSTDLRTAREANLAQAETELALAPEDPDNWIWVGRHHAYLGRYRDAIETFGEGLARFPDDPRFLRHRGHRWITVREFERAVDDLSLGDAWAVEQGRLDEIEPDGLPNPAGIPLSTLGFNLRYHLALAQYLLGDFEAARGSWEATLDVSGNPDLRVAALYWLHLTLRQLGQDEDARQAVAGVDPDLELLENFGYRDLISYFRDLRTLEDVLPEEGEGLGTVTVLYGLGARALLDGDETEARRRFHEILSRPEQWAAFGYIAAEAEMARRGW